jgi:hypothetical protein
LQSPGVTLSILLLAIRQLLGDPNPDDPLEDCIANVFREDYKLFFATARRETAKHATGNNKEKEEQAAVSIEGAEKHETESIKDEEKIETGTIKDNEKIETVSIEDKGIILLIDRSQV